MADRKAAVDFLLPLEDATMKGVIARLGDGAGLTRFGLTSKWHPELESQGFFDASMPVSQAESLAEHTYEEEYGEPLFIDQINSQAVANVLLDFAVNEGTREAVSIAQAAVGVTVDGQMGALTVAAMNNYDSTRLVGVICDRQVVFYTHIATVNAARAKFLTGWLNRVAISRARALGAE